MPAVYNNGPPVHGARADPHLGAHGTTLGQARHFRFDIERRQQSGKTPRVLVPGADFQVFISFLAVLYR
jgi:hypothetical protein